RGDLKGAAVSLDQAAQILEKGNANRELTIARFHLAGVYFSLKRKSQALESLGVVARLVEELGYDHFLTVEAARNPLLIQYAAANKLAGGYFERLLRVTKAPSAASGKLPTGTSTEAEDTTAIKCFGFGNLRAEVNGREVTDLEWRSEKS